MEIDGRRVWRQIEYNALVNNAAIVKTMQGNYKDFPQKKYLYVREKKITYYLSKPWYIAG